MDPGRSNSETIWPCKILKGEAPKSKEVDASSFREAEALVGETLRSSASVKEDKGFVAELSQPCGRNAGVQASILQGR